MATIPDLSGELALALELADLADEATLPHFRAADLKVDRKPDRTEVTAADRGAEAVIRRRLAAARPGHAVLGEEEGLVGPEGAPWRWVVDPVDGTSNFVKGVPVWATLVALEFDAHPVLGVVSAPALGRRWWGAAGIGAFADRHAIRVSEVDALEDVHLAYSDVGSFYDEGSAHWGDALVGLSRSVWRARGLGDFWMHMLVAEGAFDVAVEPVVSHWDLAAVQAVVEQAGGRFTNLRGEARPDGGSALSTNGRLHDAVLAAFAPR